MPIRSDEMRPNFRTCVERTVPERVERLEHIITLPTFMHSTRCLIHRQVTDETYTILSVNGLILGKAFVVNLASLHGSGSGVDETDGSRR